LCAASTCGWRQNHQFVTKLNGRLARAVNSEYSYRCIFDCRYTVEVCGSVDGEPPLFRNSFLDLEDCQTPTGHGHGNEEAVLCGVDIVTLPRQSASWLL